MATLVRRRDEEEQMLANAAKAFESVEPCKVPVAADKAQQQHQPCDAARCTTCARLGYRARTTGNSLLFHSQEVLDMDFGMFELVRRLSDEESNLRVDPEVALKTAKTANRHVKYFRRKLSDIGLLNGVDQNYTGASSSARVVAPFERKELRLGRLIGTGGFSSVYEVEGFEPDEVLTAGVTQTELASRQFLTQHAIRMPDPENDSTCSSSNNNALGNSSSHSRNRGGGEMDEPIARYAVKHLKHNVVKCPERFHRAALDLVMEGQLLLALDHPNIISVRGWSYQGPDAYRSGKHTDYFLILDRLPGTLDGRIMQWRQSLRKYRSRVSTLPWARKKYTAKIQRLLRERLQTAHDIASAVEYMHDRRIINRDLKVANIGLDVHGDIKVFDFGLARLLPDEEEKQEDGAFVMSRVGTRVYMSPEVRKRENYNLSADVYSFGVILWELMSLSTPRDKLTKKSRQALEDEKSNESWLPICPCWPVAIQELIKNCLAFDPNVRPSIGQVRTVIKQQMISLGMDANKARQQKRRRSTFRLDLSNFADMGSSSELMALEVEAGQSKTSHTSTCDLEESDDL